MSHQTTWRLRKSCGLPFLLLAQAKNDDHVSSPFAKRFNTGQLDPGNTRKSLMLQTLKVHEEESTYSEHNCFPHR